MPPLPSLASREGQGLVSLVGAGPGDPELLTRGALRRLEEADVILYDRLVTAPVLSLAPPRALLEDVGKRRGKSGQQQRWIEQRMIALAKQGKRVVRLKGGDPFVFGRGAEEAEALRAAGVPFEVVPGLPSAVAGPAYAGIPLTHRDLASSFAVATGKTKEGGVPSKLPQADTIVVLMGTSALAAIVRRLIRTGRAADTPAAVVHWATTPAQSVVTGPLGDIHQRARQAGISPPSLLIVGATASLREKLRWFESRPLFGREILLLRAEPGTPKPEPDRGETFLRSLGAAVHVIPLLQVVPPRSWRPLDRALDELPRFHWVVFASQNGVSGFFGRLFERGLDVRALGRTKVAAVGEKTARALRQAGVIPDLVPTAYTGKDLAAALGQRVKGKTVLVARLEDAPPALSRQLCAAADQVVEIPCYRTLPDPQGIRRVKGLLKTGRIDIIAATSSRIVRVLAADTPAKGYAQKKRAKFYAIGPETARTARSCGFPRVHTADTYTIEGLTRKIVEKEARNAEKEK